MMPEWMGLLFGLALAAVVALAAWVGLRRDRPLREQSLRFFCPLLRKAVDCRIVQDMRTGQWKRVEACSAFADAPAVRCEKECAKLMNLGFPLPHG